MKILNVLTLMAFLLIFISNTKAGEVLKITPLQGEIKFDGIPSESAWQLCEKVPLKMHFPVYGNQPSEESDVRITYDKNYLWIGAKLFYKDISKKFPTARKGMKHRMVLIILELSSTRTTIMKMHWHFLRCLPA